MNKWINGEVTSIISIINMFIKYKGIIGMNYWYELIDIKYLCRFYLLIQMLNTFHEYSVRLLSFYDCEKNKEYVEDVFHIHIWFSFVLWRYSFFILLSHTSTPVSRFILFDLDPAAVLVPLAYFFDACYLLNCIFC